jgi:DUF1680 family protein
MVFYFKKIRMICLAGISLFLATFFHQAYSQKKSIHEHHDCEVTRSSLDKYAILQPVSKTEVEITAGFWKERQEINRKVSFDVLWQLADDPEISSSYHNLKIAAGLAEGKRKGVSWMDAWIYKWIETASYILAEEPAYTYQGILLDDKVDEVIGVIEKAQAEDGYIATQTMITNIKRWDSHMNHELYVMGHLMSAAAIHHRATGKTSLLNVAKKAADHVYEIYLLKDPAMAEFPLNPSIIMGAVELYRETEESKYLELGSMVVDWRGSTWNGENSRNTWKRSEGLSDHNQNWKPLREETEVLGHSVFWSYLYAGATDVYLENGDSTLLVTMERLWKDLVSTKLNVTGGVSPVYKALVSRSFEEGTRDYILWDPIREGISEPFFIPNSNSYNETCGQIGNFMWNWRMLLATGEAKYADIMEMSIYNSILSGVELDGDAWTYTNPTRWFAEDQVLTPQSYHKRFHPGERHICCPTNVLRTIEKLDGYLYTTNPQGVQVHHFVSSEGKLIIDDKNQIMVQQITNYPWDGSVKLSIIERKGKDPFDIGFRVPGWAGEVIVSLNGSIKNIEVNEKGYAVLNHQWKKGDEISLEIPMEVKMLVGDKRVESIRNQVAVKRGPVVYCLESNDIPEQADLFNVFLDRNCTWETVEGTGVLNGLVLLKTEAFYKDVYSKPDLSLYYELNHTEGEEITIIMIPYFAWNNRKEPKMSVWLPYK